MATLEKRTRADLGRSSNRRGKDGELAVARYLAARGWPSAKRRVWTGWKVGDRVARDQGDIDGIGALCVQVKTTVTELSDNSIRKVLAQTVTQTIAAGADYGFVVQRRAGKADPGRWWAWLSIGDLYCLTDAGRAGSSVVCSGPHAGAPVRLLLDDLVQLLRLAGYGEAAA